MTAGHTLAQTFDCKTPNCTGTARSRVGRYSYCDPCQQQRARARGTVVGNGRGGLVAALDELKKLARDADAADARARKLTGDALAAKGRADELRARFAERMRELAA